MSNNLEFENEDPSPDSIEDNHPRTNYGEGYGGKETLEKVKDDESSVQIFPYTQVRGINYTETRSDKIKDND